VRSSLVRAMVGVLLLSMGCGPAVGSAGAAAKTAACVPVMWVAGTDGGSVTAQRSPESTDGVATYPDGTRLRVVGESVDATGKAWSAVQGPDGTRGYIPADSLTHSPPPAPSPTPQPARQVYVTNTDGLGVYVRRVPQLAAHIRAYPDGTVFDIVGEDSKGEGMTWRNVRTPDGITGYVPAQYVADVESTTDTASSDEAEPSADGVYDCNSGKS